MQPLMGKVGTPDGQFHDGNPATGELGTIVSALWLNALQSATRSVQSELLSVIGAAGLAADPDESNQLEVAIKHLAWGAQQRPTTLAAYGIGDGLRHYRAGQSLPSQNVGPIWHDDYGSLMVWQHFTQNGANYSGYASVLVGSLLADTQPTPRAGYIKSGTQNLSRAAYAALRGWALHNGVMVSADTWAAGAIAVADNADGSTFRVFDVRGEFPRFWDDARGVDAWRAFGSKQAGSVVWQPGFANNSAPGVTGAWDAAYNDGRGSFGSTFDDGFAGNHPAGTDIPGYGVSTPAYTVPYSAIFGFVDGMQASYNLYKGARPRNVALLAAIKY